ncbi:MAG: copper-binding protein [Propionibacteriaceae bacterium]|jgi:parallel beta-helix repeat protein|nr:copper-binding protein [Propionibacteriaceae bacterium]
MFRWRPARYDLGSQELPSSSSRRSRKRSAGRVACTAVVIALMVGSSAAVGAASAQASTLRCGDTITTDTTLTHDLLNCPANGLVIGADDVTLDLNGHTIDGILGAGCAGMPEGEDCRIGVDNRGGFSRLTVRGGTIRQFVFGVETLRGAGNALRHLSVSQIVGTGIVVGNSADAVIEKNSLSDTRAGGIVLYGSRRAAIAGNSVTGGFGPGIYLVRTERTRIQGNRVTAKEDGIGVGFGSSHNTVRGNVVVRTGMAIDLGGENLGGAVARGNRVERNLLVTNADGIVVRHAADSIIDRNRVSGTGFFGDPNAGGHGIFLDGPVNSVVRRNELTGGRGPALVVTWFESPEAARDTRLLRNVVQSNLRDGIVVEGGVIRTSVVRNTANNNGEDGIDIDDGIDRPVSKTTVTRNTANDNGDLGIEAVGSVTDGGGNRARGNGRPAQCTNVRCS